MKARVSYLSKLQKYIYSKQGSGIKPYKLCLGKVLKYFKLITWKIGWNVYVCNFSVDYNIIGFDDIINIQRYLIKKLF